MSFRAHGKWCGPGWSAGQWKDAKDLTEEDKQVSAEDALDQACKNHDIRIAEGDPEANEKFEQEAGQLGFKGAAFAALVKWLGPSTQSILQNKKNMPRRDVKEEDYEAWKSSNSIRLKKKSDEDRKTYRGFLRDENRVYNTANEQKRKATGDQRDEHAKRVLGEEEEDEADNAVVEALVNMQGDSFVTPARDTPSMAPTLTRQDRPLRGFRPEGSLTNLLNQVDEQEQGMDEPMEVMAMSRALVTTDGTGNPSKNKSVMVRYDARQEMGFLTETRTAMLPLSIYFSINKLDSSSPVVLQFVLNDTYDIFRKVDLATQTFPTLGGSYSQPYFGITGDVSSVGNIAAHNITNNLATTANVASAGTTSLDGYNLMAAYNSSSKTHVSRSKGISADMAYSIYAPSAHGMKIIKPVGINVGNAVQFPSTVKSSTAGSTTTTNSGKMGYASSPNGVAANGDYAMAWRNYYERIYRNRHVMKTEWKLTMENAQEGAYHRGVVLEAVDTITSEVTSPNYVTPINRSLAEMLRYKRIKETRLDSFNAQGGSVVNVLSGSWTPNDNRRRDVVDEELITTWYPTKNKNGPANKFWEEFQTLLFYNDQMSNNQSGYFNCRLDLLYHVQYRDLSNEFRYPDPESTTTMLQIRDTCFPVFRPTPGTGWPTIEDPNLQGTVNITSSWNQATK
jgi:hypothetical protein